MGVDTKGCVVTKTKDVFRLLGLLTERLRQL